MKKILFILAFMLTIACSRTVKAQSHPPLTIREATTGVGRTNATNLVFADGSLTITGGVVTVAGGGGSGTVTSISTTSPITGGVITTTGTIACATCVTSAASLTLNQLVFGAGSQATAVGDLTGDVSTSGGKTTAIGATKVTSAMLNADVFSTAHSWGGQQTFTAPILGTIASGNLAAGTGYIFANIASKPTTLSGYGITDAQPLNTNLTTIAALANGAGWLHNDGAGVFVYSTPSKTDVGLSAVTNDAQTKASIVPNTAPSAGQILAGNAGGTAYAPVGLSGSGATFSLSSAGVLTVSGIADGSLSSTFVKTIGITTANGVSGISSGGATPSLTVTLGAITPSSVTTPSVIGGTAVGASAEIRSTSGVGTTDLIKFTVGNNGGTEAARINDSGGVSIGSTSDAGATNLLVAGVLKVGSGPTTHTDAAGKILAAALNTVTVAVGGTGQTAYTKGDLLTAPGGASLNKLAVGSDGQVLTADAASTNGVKWAAAGGGSGTVTVVGAGSLTSTALVTGGGTTTLQTPSATTTLDSSGNLSIAGQLVIANGAVEGFKFAGETQGWYRRTGTVFDFYVEGTGSVFEIYTGGNRFGLAQNMSLVWANTNSWEAAGGQDTGIGRISAGLVGIGTGSQGSFAGDLKLNNIIVTSTTDSTSTTTGALQVAGGAAIRKRVWMDGLSTSGSGTTYMCVASNGELVNDNAACIVSALKFKDHIEPLTNGLDEVMRLRPVAFNYKTGGSRQVGLIAEEVARVDERLAIRDRRGELHSVDYIKMPALLIRAIQDQQMEIEQLRREVQELRELKTIKMQQAETEQFHRDIQTLTQPKPMSIVPAK